MDETTNLEGMIEAVEFMVLAMTAQGMSPTEICLEFFMLGHESGHMCAESHTEEFPEDDKVSAGYL